MGDTPVPREQMGSDGGEHLVGLGQLGNRPGLAAIRDARSRVREILDSHPGNDGFTPAELAALSLYEGGGGLNEEGATSADVLYAFFTAPEVISKVWELVDAYAPGAKSVLEPAAGTGRFAAGRPGNDFTLQEINPINARIAQILHPKAKIRVGAYESIFFDDTGRVHRRENPDEALYDLVVGNFPYGANASEWRGRGEGREFDRIEEYFASRGLDALKAGGLMACVMPSGFLRTLPDRAKEILAEKGELIDAWRLPNKAFATTDVGTDIVVFHRSDLRQRAEEAVAKSEMAGGQAIEGATREEKIGNAMAALRAGRMANLGGDGWFARHPGRVCGVEETRMGRFGEEKYVRLADGDADLAAALGRITPDPAIAAQAVAASAAATVGKIGHRPRSREEQTVISGRHGAQGAQAWAAPETARIPTLTASEFAAKYGKEYSPELNELWKSSDYEGVIDAATLSAAAQDYLKSHGEYIEVRPGRFQHEMLYASGNIYDKIARLDAQQNDPFDALPTVTYERNRKALLAAVPELRPMENIAFQPDTVLAEEFMVEHRNAKEGETETLPLKEAFVRWATNCDAEGSPNHAVYIANFSATPISPEGHPSHLCSRFSHRWDARP